MPLSPEAKAEIAAAIGIVREDRMEKFLRGRFKNSDPPKDPTDPPKDPTDPPKDPANPPPPKDPTDPPKDPPESKKSAWWGEIMDD